MWDCVWFFYLYGKKLSKKLEVAKKEIPADFIKYRNYANGFCREVFKNYSESAENIVNKEIAKSIKSKNDKVIAWLNTTIKLLKNSGLPSVSYEKDLQILENFSKTLKRKIEK